MRRSTPPACHFWREPVAAGILWGWLLFGGSLAAATYYVGPKQTHTNLHSVIGLLQPGDVVEVMGNATYRGDVRLNASGTPEAPITIRGVRVQGRRPVWSGVAGEEAAVMRVSGNYYRLEALEITAGGDPLATRGIRNVAHGTVIRDVVVHDCPRHGILNSDAAGSLTLSGVEVYHCGYDEPYHQVYIGMDTVGYPEAVFRMENCYVHAGRGGNNVKTRAGRNEIYYNWIEGAVHRELELLGPDRHGQPMNKAGQWRVDSDVVGNVLYKSRGTLVSVIRVGGDGSGTSHGRNRLVNNTILLDPRFAAVGVFKLQDDFETLELHNNVVYAAGEPVRLLYDPGLSYKTSGQHNWFPSGSTQVPREWKGTFFGADPGFQDWRNLNLRPVAGSPLRGQGRVPTTSPSGFEFPSPLPAPEFQPRRFQDHLAHPALVRRSMDGAVDIGAFAAD